MRPCIQHVVRLSALNGDAGHVFHFRAKRRGPPDSTSGGPISAALRPPCRLTAQDPGLSSRGMRVRIPSRRPFSLRKRRLCSEIGVRFALSDLIEASRRPEPGRGRVYSCVRGVGATRRSASPESGVRFSPSAPFGAVVFNSQHSGLLIRTVRVRIPPAPPIIYPRSLRTDVREVFSRRVT